MAVFGTVTFPSIDFLVNLKLWVKSNEWVKLSNYNTDLNCCSDWIAEKTKASLLCWCVSYLLLLAGDLLAAQEDGVMSEEAGGLSHHQQGVVEEDEVRGDRADLRTVTDINTNNINNFKQAYHV